MNRRIRKKKRVGEFQELGFEVVYHLPDDSTPAQREAFLWEFILQAVEANGLAAGGGGDNPVSLFATTDQRRGSATEEQRQAVEQWLATRPEPTAFTIQPLRDAWYGWDDE